MARPPGKRRGITLGARADSASALDLLNVQPEASVVTTGNRRGVDSSTAGGDSNATSEGLSEQLSELRRISAELEVLGTTQAEQLRQLGQQRDQIALQIRQLEARGQTPRTSGRLGILLTLLALVGAAAFGFHNWPRLQTLAGDLADVSRDLVQLAPDLRGVRGEVGSLNSSLGQMSSTVDSLREDVAGVRSDLGKLRKVVDTLPDSMGGTRAAAGDKGRRQNTLARSAATMRNPYLAMPPMRPW